jgi:integrase
VRTKLTKRLVEATQPTGRITILWDSEVRGLGLKVTPLGHKTYFLYYRTKSGQQRRPTIGKHGALTVEQARRIAKQWVAQITLGTDISGQRIAARKAETVAGLGPRYIQEYARLYKKPRSVATDHANFENHVLPVLGSMKIADVSRADIESLKMAVKDGKTARKLKAKPRGRRNIRGGAGIANRVIALVSKMFVCAQDWGLREDNPARGIRKFRENRRDRFLDAAELGRLHTALDLAEIQELESRSATVAIRLLLYTGMRVGEVINLRWHDFDENLGTLYLQNTKTGARTVPLSSHALAILMSIRKGRADDLIFPGAVRDVPIALTRPWYRIREMAEIDRTANLHCLRHTFASWSVMGGLSLPQVGAVLGHRSSQTTLRYADHLLEAVRGYSERVGNSFTALKKSGAENPKIIGKNTNNYEKTT